MTIVRVGKDRRCKVIADSPQTGISWSNDRLLADGECFSICTLPDDSGYIYRVDLSLEEISCLNHYRERLT